MRLSTRHRALREPPPGFPRQQGQPPAPSGFNYPQGQQAPQGQPGPPQFAGFPNYGQQANQGGTAPLPHAIVQPSVPWPVLT